MALCDRRVFGILFYFSFLICHSTNSNAAEKSLGPRPFHLDLEARASEYREFQTSGYSTELNQIVEAGEKNLAWLKRINAHRLIPLSFSSSQTQTGIPIEQPSVYNEEIIQTSFAELQSQMPFEMFKVLFSRGELTDYPPVDVNLYLEFGRRLDLIYQSGVRWNTLKKYLAIFVENKFDDMRGYYYLKKEPQVFEEFKIWKALKPDRRLQLVDWLKQICTNSERNFDRCLRKVSKLEYEKDFTSFFNFYFPRSEALWHHFFKIRRPRKDVIWNQADSMIVPFRRPGSLAVLSFLKDNIEAEWMLGSWQLKLNFLPNALTHIEFSPGQMPQVNGVGGSIIRMDENTPLTEYNVQWAIRHEYGHTLGFEDCYIEFYDLELRAMVNYQFDVDNLMCSRKGHLNESHLAELKKNYYKL